MLDVVFDWFRRKTKSRYVVDKVQAAVALVAIVSVVGLVIIGFRNARRCYMKGGGFGCMNPVGAEYSATNNPYIVGLNKNTPEFLQSMARVPAAMSVQ